MHKERIYKIVEYCNVLNREQGKLFNFKLTTNGVLLDEAFIDFSVKNRVLLSLSYDGIQTAHDLNRKTVNGAGSFDKVDAVVEMLLKAQPYTPAMTVITPNTLDYFAESIEYLYEKGFRYLICSLNYSTHWTQRDLNKLKNQYLKLSKFYYKHTLKENKFYFSPFEIKMQSHINPESYTKRQCDFAKESITVTPEGNFYPCVQFADMDDYCIGNVDAGLDKEKQEALNKRSSDTIEDCKACALKERCYNSCSCVNMASTGNMNSISPFLCAHEQMLIPIVDQLAEKLYKKRSPMFIQKQYNSMYPLVSLIEDKIKGSTKS